MGGYSQLLELHLESLGRAGRAREPTTPRFAAPSGSLKNIANRTVPNVGFSSRIQLLIPEQHRASLCLAQDNRGEKKVKEKKISNSSPALGAARQDKSKIDTAKGEWGQLGFFPPDITMQNCLRAVRAACHGSCQTPLLELPAGSRFDWTSCVASTTLSSISDCAPRFCVYY